MFGFKNLYGLPTIIHGTIDVNQIHIQKPKGPFVVDYFSYKSRFDITYNCKAWQINKKKSYIFS
jgi:hypothetical protein